MGYGARIEMVQITEPSTPLIDKSGGRWPPFLLLGKG
jgi:hypothetical protein